MNNYYCKNCNNIIGKWYENKYKYRSIINFGLFFKSINFNSIEFLNCENCNKFIGIRCFDVCENCFGKYEMHGEENLFNWFQIYKKLIPRYVYFNYFCTICNKNDFRVQYWYFEELTFHKQ